MKDSIKREQNKPRELKEMGFDTERTIGVYPGSSWTIVDSEDVLGVNLNIKPKR